MVMLKRIVAEPITITAAADDAAHYLESAPKEPTPLLGSWADVWSSRQASEIILEDGEKDGAAPQQPPPSPESRASESDAPAEEGMSPAASFASDAAAPECHARHVYRHDPYSTAAARADVFVCVCAACVTANIEAHAEIARRRAAARVPFYAVPTPVVAAEEPLAPPSPIKLGASADEPRAEPSFATATITATAAAVAVTPAAAAPRGGFQAHSYLPPPPPHAPRAEVLAAPVVAPSLAAQEAAQFGGSVGFAMPAAIPPHQLSAFMPPPPPSTMTASVLERDGTNGARGFVEYVAARWYAKVCATQLYFVAAEECCPDPAGRDFDEWLQECADWWFAHFEFAQMKPTVYAAHFGGGYGAGAGYEYSNAAVAPQDVW